jgi:hypothetical protein
MHCLCSSYGFQHVARQTVEDDSLQCQTRDSEQSRNVSFYSLSSLLRHHRGVLRVDRRHQRSQTQSLQTIHRMYIDLNIGCSTGITDRVIVGSEYIFDRSRETS